MATTEPLLVDALRDAAQALDLRFGLSLWDGTDIPPAVGGSPARIFIADEGALASLVRRPSLDTLTRLHGEGRIDWRGATLFELAALRPRAKLKTVLRAIGPARLARIGWRLLRTPGAPGLAAGQGDVSARRRGDPESNRANIAHHYDVSNAFYALFLDPQMVYTCAWFQPDFHDDLARAQRDKLDLICRKLRLAPGQRLLDIGCGWGALIRHAARDYGVTALGVTLSQEQAKLARARIADEGLADRARVEVIDFAALKGESFDAIASIGMFEHVGLAHHTRYFEGVRRLLKPGGLYLHHCIARPAKGSDAQFRRMRPEYRAILRYVFPGAELDHLGLSIAGLERARFEVHDVEALRLHYARTTRLWHDRLLARRAEAEREVGAATTRLWLMYLAGVSLGFERGTIGVNQTLASRRDGGRSRLPATRGDLHAPAWDRGSPAGGREVVSREKPPNGRLTFSESARLVEAGSRYVAGGVNSSFRAGMGGGPLVFERGEGPYLFDADGARLIDYYGGMGAAVLGHDPAGVREAVRAQVEKGILFAGQSRLEYEAARLICERVPSAERVRFCSSGSEAAQAAMRLARAATGRAKIVKFEGHYHGWFDNILWSTAPALNEAGPREAPVAVGGSAGQAPGADAHLVVLPWNDADALAARLAEGDVAAVLMEPAMCNQGAIAPAPGYLESARAACREHGALLIFDEVITGFRLGRGGAQARFGVTPDLTILAKAIASGFPVGALAGRAELMELLARGGVVHGGTFNAQPVCMAAAIATLNALTDAHYSASFAEGLRLRAGVAAAIAEAGVQAQVTGFELVFHVAFGLDAPARDWRDLARADRAAYARFAHALLTRGVRALERGAWFVSAAHRGEVIDRTLDIVREAAREIAAG